MAPLAQRANAADMGHAAPALLDVWIYANLIGNTVLLPILVATFLCSKRAKRHPTLVNVCMTWILSGIFSILLFYAGQERGPEPHKPLCIAQTALLAGITPMWATAVLVLLYNMILVVNNPSASVGRFKMFIMLSAPYLVEIAFSVTALVGSLEHPQRVSRARRYFYCTLRWNKLSMAMMLYTSAVGVAIIIAMIYLAVILYRNWHGFRHAGRPSHVHGPLLLRVFIFGGYIIFGFAVNVIFMLAPHNLAPDMYAATIGTVIFLVFGTQADVLRTWCFWMSEPQPQMETVYLPREPSWRESLDLTKSAVPPGEDFAHKQEKPKPLDLERQWEHVERGQGPERNKAWSEISQPPTVVTRN
ncbi:hypothetical protein DFH08DRAFT_948899 [Mycena albidolilacea]|uniref:Uncharacterized protein n=1 Tax=Mycena albidolilacea TaxID=1033008 RepID=A0AAD7F3H6_9AGAR|nr:hypothetical protein DFH08DRAFT_948899 [Mycena albidolilacea]